MATTIITAAQNARQDAPPAKFPLDWSRLTRSIEAGRTRFSAARAKFSSEYPNAGESVLIRKRRISP